MKIFRKIVWFKIIMTIVAMSFSWAIASDLTVDRSALIQKIESFLKNEAATKAFAEKGVDTSKMISKLDSLSDAQLVKLAEQVPSNLSQVGGAIDDSGVKDFWATWGLIIIIATVVPLLLLVALA